MKYNSGILEIAHAILTKRNERKHSLNQDTQLLAITSLFFTIIISNGLTNLLTATITLATCTAAITLYRLIAKNRNNITTLCDSDIAKELTKNGMPDNEDAIHEVKHALTQEYKHETT